MKPKTCLSSFSLMLFFFGKSQQKYDMRTAIVLMIWVFIIPVGLLSIFYYKYSMLAAHADTVHAKVIELNPKEHNSIKYQFAVNGKTYQGSENGLADRLNLGSDLIVYYDPNDPTNCSIGDPSGLARGMLFALVLIFIVCVAVGGAALSFHHWKGSVG